VLKVTVRAFVVMFVLGAPVPVLGAQWSADLNCDGETNVADVMLSIIRALDMPVSDQLDENGNGIPDDCEGVSMDPATCGTGTELAPDGLTCVVSQWALDDAYADGFDAGVMSPPDNVVFMCAETTFGQVSWDPLALGWEGSCESWTECLPGTFVFAQGSTTSNQECVSCGLGVGYSNTFNAPACEPVTPCDPGFKEVVAPTETSNRVCEAIVVSLELIDQRVYEGGEVAGSFTISLNGALDEDLSVVLQSQGSASSGTDYGLAANGVPVTDSAVIPAGMDTVTVVVTPVVTADLEPTETLEVMLGNTNNYQVEPEAAHVELTFYEHGPSPGAVYYVSETGSDTQVGSWQAPFATVSHGVNQLSAGDTLYILDGTYHNAGWTPSHGDDGTQSIQNPLVAQVNVAGTPDAWIRIAAYPDGNDVRPLLEFDGSGGIEFKPGTQYVMLEGVEIKGPNQEIQMDWAHEHRWSKESFYKGRGIFSWGPVDHIVVRDCHVHHTPGSGIRFNKADYILVENNIVANTTWWSSSAESAIVIATAAHIDDLDAVKFLYSGNTVYNNWNFMEFCNTPLFGQTEDAYGNCDTYSGGIIDGQGLYVTRNRDTYLHGRMRFENNVAYNNGFGGVVYHKTDRGELVNNLVFMNGSYPGNSNYSGMTLNTADDVLIINNVIWARDSNDYGLKNNGNASNVTATHNLVVGKTQFGATDENTYLLFGAAPLLESVFVGASDISGINPDPLLTSGPLSPAQVSATLKAVDLDFYPVEGTSWLQDAGTDVGAPSIDSMGVPRPQGSGVDRGPYEWTPLF